MDKKLENALKNLVRVGTVSSVDASNNMARVIFRDKDNTVSGWLPVLQHIGAAVNILPDGDPVHSHPDSTLGVWMPKIGQTVLAVYLPVFNADGFILGAM